MGWCAEFGCRIRDGCDHPMVAGKKACVCTHCAVVCKGRFNGCPEVWLAGPRTGAQPVLRQPTVKQAAVPAPAPAPAPAPTPTPATPVVPAVALVTPAAPVADATTVALASLRGDVDGLFAILSEVVVGLKELSSGVDQLARSSRESVERLGRELAQVTDALARQQTPFEPREESPPAAVHPLSPYEQLVEERRLRTASNAAAEAALAARRRLLPRIPRTLQDNQGPTDHPTSAPDLHEADGQPR